MPPVNASYVTNGVPFGALLDVTIYRPTSPLTPGSSPTTLSAAYTIENLTLTGNGILIKRPAADGGDNGWAIVKGTIEGNCTIQVPSGTSPTLLNGDFFILNTDVNGQQVESDTNGAEVTLKCVIHSPSLALGTTDYRKQSCSIIVDSF